MEKTRRRPTHGDKFAYIIPNTWIIPATYVFGILAWFGVIAGYVVFFGLDRRYWFVFAPILAVVSAYHLITYGINLFYRPFDVKKHGRKVNEYWRGVEETPTVDVFLPVCGEDMHVLTETFAAVRDMEYPSKTVFVLDDDGDSEVRRLAEKMGFEYLSRPDKGVLKKAGNLRFGHARSKGEFIAVFDADFAPHADFLKELLPYMADPKTAIVQSPQHFRTDDSVHGRSALEFGAGQTQEDFYRIIQVARDRFGAAICVGSNALYRRSALDVIGGFSPMDHSEDVHTGFDILAKGLRLVYVPLVLATGVCPNELHSYFHQQHRWCSGSMSLWFSRKFREAKLTLGQRLSFWSGYLYYANHVLSLVMAFQIFLVLFFHYEAVSWTYALPFIPHLFFSFVMLPLLRTTRPRYGSFLVRVAHSFSYAHSVLSNLIKGPMKWHPTNAASAVVSSEFSGIVTAAAVYVLAYAALVSYAASTGRLPIGDADYYPVLFWVWYFFVTNGLFLVHAWRTMDRKRAATSKAAAHVAWRGRSLGMFAAATLLTVAAGYGAGTRTAAVVAATKTEAEMVMEAIVAEPVVVESPMVLADAFPVSGPVSYSATAAAGDSLHILYRRIITDFCTAENAAISRPGRVYMETTLVAADGRDSIAIGADAVAKTSHLRDLANEAAALEGSKLAAWNGYADAVTFEKDCDSR